MKRSRFAELAKRMIQNSRIMDDKTILEITAELDRMDQEIGAIGEVLYTIDRSIKWLLGATAFDRERALKGVIERERWLDGYYTL